MAYKWIQVKIEILASGHFPLFQSATEMVAKQTHEAKKKKLRKTNYTGAVKRDWSTWVSLVGSASELAHR